MTEFRWHYGPTAGDPDRGKRWHDGCGGEIWTLKGGADACSRCGAVDDTPDAPTRPADPT